MATVGFIEQPQSQLYEPVEGFPFVMKEFKTLLEQQDDSNESTCSLAEALEKQDLFINSTLCDGNFAVMKYVA